MMRVKIGLAKWHWKRDELEVILLDKWHNAVTQVYSHRTHFLKLRRQPLIQGVFSSRACTGTLNWLGGLALGRVGRPNVDVEVLERLEDTQVDALTSGGNRLA